MADLNKYRNEFNRENYDRVNIMLPKGKKEFIKNIASQNGESVNEFINNLLRSASNMSDAEWKAKAI